ncbi:MAG: hypothetical protein MdMp014T_0996 [Treponematales bacterium]
MRDEVTGRRGKVTRFARLPIPPVPRSPLPIPPDPRPGEQAPPCNSAIHHPLSTIHYPPSPPPVARPRSARTWRVEVRTYFSGSGRLLKNQRVIRLDKDLSVAP